MARPATGSPRWNPTEKRWEVRISLPGVGRPPAPLDGIPPCLDGTPLAKGHSCTSCDRARRVAKLVSDKARAAGAVPRGSGECWNEWFDRYIEVHERMGKLARGMSGASRQWIAPTMGTVPMTALRREHVVQVRDGLTRAVLAEKVSSKRAMNVWSACVVAPMSRAFHDDDPRYTEVRVGPADANPAIGIKPPVTKQQLDEDRRERQPLYPTEFVQLMSCPRVPLAAKRIYAVATFLYTRPQELYALRFSDINWEAGEVRIRRKLDVRTGEEKAGTKSEAGIREVPIHENLMPLLEAMRVEAKDDNALLFPVTGSARLFDRLAEQTRRDVRHAGLGRRELVDGTEDLMPFDFRSWRTTGCTWLAMLGTDSYVIAAQAGHKTPETTWANYIKRGPDLRRRHGEPFPALPAALLDPAAGNWSGFGLPAKKTRENSGDFAERAGFEPAVGF